jgi:hypothetical protein
VRSRAIPVLLAIALLGGMAVATRRKKAVDPDDADVDNEPEHENPMTHHGTPLKPAAVGEATDPEVAPLLAAFDARLATAGVNLKRINAFKLFVMSKAPLVDGPDEDDDATRPVAVAPLEYWDRLVEIAVFVNDVDAAELGDLDMRYTGYRPADYNKAVGGAPDSQHIWGWAIDGWLPKKLIAQGGRKLTEARERMRMAVARAIVHSPKKNRFGFGVYTNDFHADLGRDRLTHWEHGEEYLEKAEHEKLA